MSDRPPSSVVSSVSSPSFILPSVITEAGEETSQRFVEFFLVSIRNQNTRTAYAHAVRQFLNWCEERGMEFSGISAIAIAAYIESRPYAAPTTNLHLAAIRSLFQWLVDGRILDRNPAAEVKGIKHRVKTGKTPVLSDEEMKQLLEGLDTSHVVGLRDRALIATMFYSFARISAVVGMSVEDYFTKGRRTWIRLCEKGGKYHEIPVHHTAESYLDDYINAAEIASEKKSPLFRTTVGRTRKLTERRLERREAWAMIKRRAEDTGVNGDACNHTFRASGITNYLRNGGSRDNAQKIAAHSDVRTTALYDRRDESISLDEIERIRL